MENLSLHIEYLLNRHDCVIIPGFGAFINIYHSPVFDSINGKITPPCREIRFNHALRSDDGLLANSFARKLGVTYREGAEILARSIESMERILLKDREITIGRIGILKLESEGNLLFSPFSSAIGNAEKMGCVAINVSSTQESSYDHGNLDSKIRIEILNSNQKIKSQDTSSPKITISDNDFEKLQKLDFKKNFYIPINKNFSKLFAASIIFVIIVCSWFLPTSLKESKEERASVVPFDKVIDSAVKTYETSPIESSNDSTQCHSKTAKEISLNENSKEHYNERFFLIVATCSTREEAQRYAESFKEKGFDTEVVGTGKKFRVSVKSSFQKQDLIEIMNSSDFKQQCSASWIWKES